jgi:hypothetical protein
MLVSVIDELVGTTGGVIVVSIPDGVTGVFH